MVDKPKTDTPKDEKKPEAKKPDTAAAPAVATEEDINKAVDAAKDSIKTSAEAASKDDAKKAEFKKHIKAENLQDPKNVIDSLEQQINAFVREKKDAWKQAEILTADKKFNAEAFVNWMDAKANEPGDIPARKDLAWAGRQLMGVSAGGSGQTTTPPEKGSTWVGRNWPLFATGGAALLGMFLGGGGLEGLLIGAVAGLVAMVVIPMIAPQDSARAGLPNFFGGKQVNGPGPGLTQAVAVGQGLPANNPELTQMGNLQLQTFGSVDKDHGGILAITNNMKQGDLSKRQTVEYILGKAENDKAQIIGKVERDPATNAVTYKYFEGNTNAYVQISGGKVVGVYDSNGKMLPINGKDECAECALTSGKDAILKKLESMKLVHAPAQPIPGYNVAPPAPPQQTSLPMPDTGIAVTQKDETLRRIADREGLIDGALTDASVQSFDGGLVSPRFTPTTDLAMPRGVARDPQG